jgi:hypothetical protein
MQYGEYNTVRGCYLHDNYFETISNYPWGNHFLIENNVLAGNYRIGVTIMSPYPESDVASHDIIIRNNLIYGVEQSYNSRSNNRYGAIYLNDASDKSIYNVFIYNNLIAYYKSAFFFSGAHLTNNQHGLYIYNNTIRDCDQNSFYFADNNTWEDVYIQNNVSYNPVESHVSNLDIPVYYSHNNWYPANLDYVEGEGDVLDNPSFPEIDWDTLQVGNVDETYFIPGPLTNLEDAALPLDSVFATDYYGAQRPAGCCWDIGAFERHHTGNHSLVNSRQISIYPNPASASIHIETGSDERFGYGLYNSAGILIDKGNFTHTHTIDISNNQRGLYILELNDGRNRIAEKIVLN